MSNVKVLEWRRVDKGALVGFAKVEFPSGVIFVDVGIMSGKNGLWAMPPSKPRLDREGKHMERNGKKVFQPLVEFTSREVSDRWSGAVLDALQRDFPGEV